MRAWIAKRLLDLAYYCPFQWPAHLLVSWAMNMVSNGPTVRCVQIKKWMEWSLEVDEDYVRETERLIDKGATQCVSER